MAPAPRSHAKRLRSHKIQKPNNKRQKTKPNKLPSVDNKALCQPSSTPATLSEFSLFPKLPLELRLMILELALCQPRVLRLWTIYRAYPVVLSDPDIIPPMFHVNYESRDRAKKIYETVTQAVWTHPTKSSYAVNPAADILCLAGRLDITCFKELVKDYPVMSTLKHLAFRDHVRPYDQAVGPDNGVELPRDCFPNLDQITIIKDIWRLEGDDHLPQSERNHISRWILCLRKIWREKHDRELPAKITIMDHKSSLTSAHTVFHELKPDFCYVKQLQEIASLYPKYC
ncbi:hypothetical protein GLAREA_04240 [Glarea lozoyensis ATCC 20868]|uniref:2EXR domain-containing protein n=1 Tax=Glarea lozoyensis (strain ATCC 20868 / MF5171) TaxID=1116229 RepID=S3CQQ6_GLAL2|nr:uncharacterized protein GLAREA_04240 [Glarea lozoyensis ATCC 20868]EPE27449.1 hypothetical protein GLAREA_04240 [Glarea lozoyensis ATCC 20868]